MNEKSTIIIESNSRETATSGLPKTNMGQLIGYFSRKLGSVSSFIHKWAKP